LDKEQDNIIISFGKAIATEFLYKHRLFSSLKNMLQACRPEHYWPKAFVVNLRTTNKCQKQTNAS